MKDEGLPANQTEYGDFQTPLELAREVCAVLLSRGIAPAALIEPTCGKGSFIKAALASFTGVKKILGIDLNPAYIDSLKSGPFSPEDSPKLTLLQGNFFEIDWEERLESLPGPILILGNPPWVTNAGLSSVGGSNRPPRKNLHHDAGLDAKTGKGNFDISEWMLIQMLRWSQKRPLIIAMLCKTAVARKVLAYAWENRIAGTASLYQIDAKQHFEVTVDAGLLLFDATRPEQACCKVYAGLDESKAPALWGYRDGRLIADLARYEAWAHLSGRGLHRWRSGLKHDCSKVMELTKLGENLYRNGFNESVELEGDYVYPLLKSSEIASAAAASPVHWVLVPQRFIGEETAPIRTRAPKTWEYLETHAEYFARRKSSIYRNRPPFSIFGVGDYTFSEWKVAISGLYKALNFSVIGSYWQKPVVLDDTGYFIACKDRAEAEFIGELLNSEPAKEFYRAFIFWDAKRPITGEILNRLDPAVLAEELGVAENGNGPNARRND